MSPAEQAALVDRMERVDERLDATQRESGPDTAIAESDTMSVSDVPAKPAWVSHSFISRVYRPSSSRTKSVTSGRQSIEMLVEPDMTAGTG